MKLKTDRPLITIMMPAGMFLGLLLNKENHRIELSHVVSLSEPEQGAYLLTPEPFPLNLVDSSIGEDMQVIFNDADVIMACELPLKVDSPHAIVQRFIEYWGLVLEKPEAKLKTEPIKLHPDQ